MKVIGKTPFGTMFEGRISTYAVRVYRDGEPSFPLPEPDYWEVHKGKNFDDHDVIFTGKTEQDCFEFLKWVCV